MSTDTTTALLTCHTGTGTLQRTIPLGKGDLHLQVRNLNNRARHVEVTLAMADGSLFAVLFAGTARKAFAFADGFERGWTS